MFFPTVCSFQFRVWPRQIGCAYKVVWIFLSYHRWHLSSEVETVFTGSYGRVFVLMFLADSVRKAAAGVTSSPL